MAWIMLGMAIFGAAVLALGRFGASAYLLDYYYAHVASRTVFFPSCADDL